ncbi:flagellar hook-basal body complex protein FliE [Balnearium lithotrophicum]|uniref:Flagellar hook-basal body complex protein FliE n=1 Tax=Balnearium lithotrophicum TaxID=223788 RepID=A0A521CAP8_9BACT|nr:flagellar hook-basal body complex protein FliE [Balnearium lithotrophicum]SMO56468.1 flagellar hook-basal body complex protein FliE [Balnearium lithotrophicum]
MKIFLDSNIPNQVLGQKYKNQKSGFEEVLEGFLKEVNQNQISARNVENLLSQGKIKNFEEAMFIIEKADISLRLLTEIRNKALESYQEIMRMQV